MTRVLHVICDLAGGGAERLVLDLARGATRSTHAVALVHPTGSLRSTFLDHGIPLHDLGRTRGRPGLGAILRLSRLAPSFDLVHTHLWAGDTWGRLGAALGGQRAVLTTEHNTRPEDPWRQRISVALHPFSRVVVGVSAAAAEMAIASGVPARKVRVIHNGVDLAGFEARPPREGPLRRALGLGRLVPQKGFDIAAAAVATRPGMVLELLGEGPEAERLRDAGAVLLGWQADIRPHLARADVLLMPSRWEGFGLVAVEAMAAGVPVIAARIPALEEVVGEAGLLVPPESPAALAHALDRLEADPALRRRLSEAGPLRAQAFSLPRMIAAYEALYQELAAGLPRS